MKGGIKMETIKFKNLSGWLKVAVVSSLVIGGLYAYYFLIGFVGAL